MFVENKENKHILKNLLINQWKHKYEWAYKPFRTYGLLFQNFDHSLGEFNYAGSVEPAVYVRQTEKGLRCIMHELKSCQLYPWILSSDF